MVSQLLLHSIVKIQQLLESHVWLLWTIKEFHWVHQHIEFLLHSQFLNMGGGNAAVVLDQDAELYDAHG